MLTLNVFLCAFLIVGTSALFFPANTEQDDGENQLMDTVLRSLEELDERAFKGRPGPKKIGAQKGVTEPPKDDDVTKSTKLENKPIEKKPRFSSFKTIFAINRLSTLWLDIAQSCQKLQKVLDTETANTLSRNGLIRVLFRRFVTLCKEKPKRPEPKKSGENNEIPKKLKWLEKLREMLKKP